MFLTTFYGRAEKVREGLFVLSTLAHHIKSIGMTFKAQPLWATLRDTRAVGRGCSGPQQCCFNLRCTPSYPLQHHIERSGRGR